MELDGLVQQVLSGLDATHPTKPEPISDTDAATKSLDEILNAISNPQPETPTPHESALDKLVNELKNFGSGSGEQKTGQNPLPPPDLFGPQEDWGEERY